MNQHSLGPCLPSLMAVSIFASVAQVKPRRCSTEIHREHWPAALWASRRVSGVGVGVVDRSPALQGSFLQHPLEFAVSGVPGQDRVSESVHYLTAELLSAQGNPEFIEDLRNVHPALVRQRFELVYFTGQGFSYFPPAHYFPAQVLYDMEQLVCRLQRRGALTLYMYSKHCLVFLLNSEPDPVTRRAHFA